MIAELPELQEEIDTLLAQSEYAYYNFRPRPDQTDRFDEQASFVNSRLPGVAWLIGGNGAGTTECALHKVAKFVLQDQPPPRKDTPFWIISGTYEQVCKAAWKEKLYGHGHIPGGEVDWDRVRWYRPNQQWPYEVPLKPWPGKPGKNWSLVFKSYEQGRQLMQAESIGGFCFIEQFPWDLLTEVLRGCREYSFRGAKICEFTPIDPYLSEPVWEMIENNRLPDGWGVFRANTECAKEAGHVSAEWFEEFFGMVPEEMLLTRLIGARASYEGSVYQGFNSKIHVAGEEAFEFPLGAHHRRSIDWGFGIENAFVCLWGYKIGSGIWFIYDEYYSTDQSKTILDHLESIGERHEWPRDSFHGTTWADPSDPGSIRLAQAAGFPVTPARNAVHEGIDYVRYLLKTIPGIGKPRLIIHGKNCPNLVRQMKTYRYQRGPTTGNNPRDGKPEPLKKDDHAVDALRYMVFSEHQHSGLSQSTSPRDFKPERFGIHTDFNGRGLLSGFANRRVE